MSVADKSAQTQHIRVVLVDHDDGKFSAVPKSSTSLLLPLYTLIEVQFVLHLSENVNAVRCCRC